MLESCLSLPAVVGAMRPRIPSRRICRTVAVICPRCLDPSLRMSSRVVHMRRLRTWRRRRRRRGANLAPTAPRTVGAPTLGLAPRRRMSAPPRRQTAVAPIGGRAVRGRAPPVCRARPRAAAAACALGTPGAPLPPLARIVPPRPAALARAAARAAALARAARAARVRPPPVPRAGARPAADRARRAAVVVRHLGRAARALAPDLGLELLAVRLLLLPPVAPRNVIRHAAGLKYSCPQPYFWPLRETKRGAKTFDKAAGVQVDHCPGRGTLIPLGGSGRVLGVLTGGTRWQPCSSGTRGRPPHRRPRPHDPRRGTWLQNPIRSRGHGRAQQGAALCVKSSQYARTRVA